MVDQASFTRIAEEQYSLLLQWLIEQELVNQSNNYLDIASLIHFRIFKTPRLDQAGESVGNQVRKKLADAQKQYDIDSETAMSLELMAGCKVIAYYQEVEWVRQLRVPTIGQGILKKKLKDLNLDEKNVVNLHPLKNGRWDAAVYQNNLEKYDHALREAIQKDGIPLRSSNAGELRQLQLRLGISPRRVIPPEALRSESLPEMDYIPLWRLLEKAEWEAANRETQRLLLQLIKKTMQNSAPEVEAMTLLQILQNILWYIFWYILVNRQLEQAKQSVQPLLRLFIQAVVKTPLETQQTDDSITSTTLNRLPCTDLLTIDHLWLQFSQGRYGFSVQRQLLWWLEDDWEQFTQQSGWDNRLQGLSVPSQQTKPGEFPYLQNVFSLVFPSSADYPEQFLADCTVELLRRLETCPIRLAA